MNLANQHDAVPVSPEEEREPLGDFKIVFAGPMGAGKTTAIAALSDRPPVSTEVANTDQAACNKATTTVGMDYGTITLGNGSCAHLYGTPGQDRFRFMWGILSRQAAGLLVLLDATRSDALEQMEAFLDAFEGAPPTVVGVGRTEHPQALPIAAFIARLGARGRMLPVFSVDVRRRPDVLLLLDTVLHLIEARAAGDAA